MKELIKEVCSLELAKKLKELGVKQESIFYHLVFEENTAIAFKQDSSWALKQGQVLALHQVDEYYSAFTAAELGEVLPDYQEKIGNFLVSKALRGWEVSYFKWKYPHRMDKKFIHTEIDKKEADARARLLIYLIENKLLLVKDIQ